MTPSLREVEAFVRYAIQYAATIDEVEAVLAAFDERLEEAAAAVPQEKPDIFWAFV